MLLQGSDGRGAGATLISSRGSTGGRDRTSRGASSFSSTPSTGVQANHFERERAENALMREHKGYNAGVEQNGNGGPRGLFNKENVDTTDQRESNSRRSSPVPSNPFGGKSSSSAPSFGFSTPPPANPFAPTTKTDPPRNPFGTSNGSALTPGILGTSSQTVNAFGGPSKPSSVFGAPSGVVPTGTSNAFGNPSTFGAPSSTTLRNPFLPPPTTNGIQNASSTFNNTKPPTSGAFGGTSNPDSTPLFSSPNGFPPTATGPFTSNAFTQQQSQPASTSTAFGTAPQKPVSGPFSDATRSTSNAVGIKSAKSVFGDPSKPPGPRPSQTTFGGPTKTTFSGNGDSSTASFTTSGTKAFGTRDTLLGGFANGSTATANIAPTAQKSPNTSGNALAKKLDQHLRQHNINPPKWPAANPGDPRQKDAVKSFWMTPLKGYRTKVRASLIQAGYLDDPEKPKKLSEAIDFKGTCEDMCPEFEKFTRIVDHSVDSHEKDQQPDGSMWPSMNKMVKALARSAAGQDAPLPMDVRTPASLRRTLNYLMHTILGEDNGLPRDHGFLWDRTRAIRRDFVFQQSAMNSSEMSDQIYCLEVITRFHVIALHHMSRDDLTSEDFSEQQEVEQLGKALLSLIHAYDDCNGQGITCANEAEFRAYYVLFNSHNTAILESVQDWGSTRWKNSLELQVAVNLVEALQNIWDIRGPLKPYETTDITLNSYSRFFSIIEDPSVSYVMACFAEVHFNSVRKSIFKTILTSYRKQRDQTKEWTLSKLNAYLRFDHEDDVITFGEAYGLRFEGPVNEEYLSFDSADPISDPFPPLKQSHSYGLVERKRGDHSLSKVINVTVYEEVKEESLKDKGVAEDSAEESLFVTDGSIDHSTPAIIEEEKPRETERPAVPPPEPAQGSTVGGSASAETAPKPLSIFDRVTKAPDFGKNFFTQSLDPKSSSEPRTESAPKEVTSVQPRPSIFSQGPSTSTTAFSTWSFLKPTPAPTPVNTAKQPELETPQQLPPSITSTFGSTSHLPQIGSTASPTTPASIIPNINNKFGTDHTPTPKPFFVLPKAPDTPTIPFSASLKPQINVTQPTQIFQPALAPEPTAILPPNDAKVSENQSQQKFAKFTDWFTRGENGIIDQFTAHYVENLLKATMDKFSLEEERRRAKEADDMARREAAEYRYRSLATKYVSLWREGAHRLWQRRMGLKSRKLRREMAEKLQAEKLALAASLVEDFKASTRRRGSLESLLDSETSTNAASSQASRSREHDTSPKKRQKSHRSSKSVQITSSQRKMKKSDDPLRRSLLSDPSYLSGHSRTHLMSDYSASQDIRCKSGVQTDYFRLKARGITPLPCGSVLANSSDPLRSRNSSDDVAKTTQKRSRPHGVENGYNQSRSGADRPESMEALKAKAKGYVEESKGSRKRQSVDIDDDEELFARAKRVREQMDEGSQWFRQQLEMDAARRSVS